MNAFTSTSNIDELLNFLKKNYNVNDNFKEDLINCMRQVKQMYTAREQNAKKQWGRDAPKPLSTNELNTIVLSKCYEIITDRLHLKEEAEKNIETVKKDWLKLVESYNKAAGKEDFTRIVQSRFPLRSLLGILDATDAGILEDNVLSKWLKEYVNTLERDEIGIDRSGFVGDNPRSSTLDGVGNIKISLPEDQGLKEYIIHVDSRNRDVGTWTLPNRYRFNFSGTQSNGEGRSIINNIFNKKLTNVVQVKLLRCTFTNVSLIVGASDELPYLLIDIDELEGNTYTSIPSFKRVFGRLQNTQQRSVINRYIALDTTGCVKQYQIRQSKDSLGALTINLLNPAGELVDFGIDGARIVSGSVAASTVITTATDHGVTTGDRVYINNFEGSDNDSEVNNLNGHIATVLTPTTFTIPVTLGVAGSGGFVLIGFKQHSFTFSIKIIPDQLATKFPKVPVPANG